MKENESALFSRYIIDGIQQDATPYEILSECLAGQDQEPAVHAEYADIIDESMDPPVTSFTYRAEDNEVYMNRVADFEGDRPFRLLYPETFTKQRVAGALIDRIWNKGHYKLGNLRLWAEWEWNSRPLGNMAAFYNSVQAASEYIYDLGCRLEDWSYDGCDEESSLRVGAWLPEGTQTNDEADIFKASPYESRHPWIGDDRKCPAVMTDDPDTWIVYIPFDTCAFKLGGSLLAYINGHNGGPAPQIMDADYFIDCYEVVRELVEDGIVMAGVTVGDGGLAKAAAGMCTDCGINLNIRGIASSYMEEDTTRILFSEVPGVLIQVSGTNMDYLDSQLLLQDVAYYPLGSPEPGSAGVSIRQGEEITVAGILASLINQASEGED
jgi:hypothetical protein